MLNQFSVVGAAILYGALILGADLLLETGDVIAIAYLGMAFPCLWLTWAPGPVLCALAGAVFIAIGGAAGAGGAVDPALTLAARGGSVVALLGAGLLAAGRIKADQALRLAVERFTDVLEVSADWIWETDAEHRFTFVSRRAFELTGAKPEDLLGVRRTDVLKRNEDGGDVAGHMADLIARRPFHGFAYWADTPTGRRCYSVSGKPLFDRRGRFTGYRGAGRDVTDRALIEEELKQATQAAEAANRAKSEFLSTMSHELRTPLNAVIGFSEVIADEMFGPVGHPKYLEYARDIQSSGRHLLDMISDILDISRIEAGRMDLADEPVSLIDVIDRAVQMVDARAEKVGVIIETRITEDLPNLLGDRRALIQILLNLLTNAVKFTPRGGGIYVMADRMEDGGVEVAVADTGVGIPADELGELMQPFAQASNQAAASEGGTGLGLYLVRRLVEQQDGHFVLESEQGRGTVAVIVWPESRLTDRLPARPAFAPEAFIADSATEPGDSDPYSGRF